MSLQTQQQIIDEIRRQATAAGVNPALAVAVAEHESGFQPDARGAAGEIGLFQLMPSTAAGLGVSDPWNPAQNIAGGIKYLNRMMERYAGDVTRALAAYNAGPGDVDRGTVPERAWQYAAAVKQRAVEWTHAIGRPDQGKQWSGPLPPRGASSMLIFAAAVAGASALVIFS